MMNKRFLIIVCAVLVGLVTIASLGEVTAPAFAVEQLQPSGCTPLKLTSGYAAFGGCCGCGCKATVNTNTVGWQPVSVPAARFSFAQAGCDKFVSPTVKLVFSQDCIQDVFHPPNAALCR